jgi:protein-S-isoprenylcysteine O-methyltransferase Ste14
MAQALKSTLGLLSLVMMCLAIFLPAGTVYYPEAWCYLVIFFTGVISISIYIFRNDKALLQSRLKGGATAEKRSLQKLVQAVASLGFVGLYIIAAFDHRFHWSHVPQWVVIAPDLVLLFTMLLFFVVFKKNSYLSALIEVQEGQKIIDNGPYGVIRHPMYSAALLLLFFRP